MGIYGLWALVAVVPKVSADLVRAEGLGDLAGILKAELGQNQPGARLREKSSRRS